MNCSKNMIAENRYCFKTPITQNSLELNSEVSTRVRNILETIYFWSYLEMRRIVLYTSANLFFLLYNATLFVTIDSSRISLRKNSRDSRERNCCC